MGSGPAAAGERPVVTRWFLWTQMCHRRIFAEPRTAASRPGCPLSPWGSAGFGAHHAFRDVRGFPLRELGSQKVRALLSGAGDARSPLHGTRPISLLWPRRNGLGRVQDARIREWPGAAAGVARPSSPRTTSPSTRWVICPLTFFFFLNLNTEYKVKSHTLDSTNL